MATLRCCTTPCDHATPNAPPALAPYPGDQLSTSTPRSGALAHGKTVAGHNKLDYAIAPAQEKPEASKRRKSEEKLAVPELPPPPDASVQPAQ
ncbi:unnamed protein product [Coccothraustes coccothraustes]